MIGAKMGCTRFGLEYSPIGEGVCMLTSPGSALRGDWAKFGWVVVNGDEAKRRRRKTLSVTWCGGSVAKCTYRFAIPSPRYHRRRRGVKIALSAVLLRITWPRRLKRHTIRQTSLAWSTLKVVLGANKSDHWNKRTYRRKNASLRFKTSNISL